MSEKEHQILEYRMTKLEEAVSALTNLEKIVLKWDVKFSEMGAFEFSSQKIAVENLVQKTEKLETEIGKLKAAYYKAMGVLTLLSILVQVFGPGLIDKVEGKNAQKVELTIPDK